MSSHRGTRRRPYRRRPARHVAPLLAPLLLLLAAAAPSARAQPTDSLNDTTCPPILKQPFPEPKQQRTSRQLQERQLLQRQPQHRQRARRLDDPAARVVGGQLSAALPFLASLHTDSGGYHCTGVVIAARAILTAARCAPLLDARRPFVRVGGFRRTEGVFIPIATVLPHPSYAGTPGIFDSALVRLRNPIPSPAPVPLATDANMPPPDSSARLYSYGIAPDAPIGERNRPRSLDLVGRPCLEDALCYGRREKGCRTCEGDAGSPLITFSKDEPPRPVLVGVASSASRSCAGARDEDQDEAAVVFVTRAATLVQWLRGKGVDFGAVVESDLEFAPGADGPSQTVIDEAVQAANAEGSDGDGGDGDGDGDKDDDDGGWSGGLIAVVAVVAVLAVIGIPLLAWLAWRASGVQQVRAIEREGAELAGSGVVGGGSATEASMSRRDTDGL